MHCQSSRDRERGHTVAFGRQAPMSGPSCSYPTAASSSREALHCHSEDMPTKRTSASVRDSPPPPPPRNGTLVPSATSSAGPGDGVGEKCVGPVSPGLVLLGVFAGSLAVMALLAYNFPELNDEDVARLKLPLNIEDAKDLGRLLSKYKDTHYFTVFTAIIFTYMFLQTFAIPGSISLSILSGFLFPFPLALLLVCTCSAMGATFCYLLSAMVGRGLVQRYFPTRLKSWREQVSRHHGDMLWYIIFLRITPFLPNWFINIASPIIGVSMSPFFWGTFLGVAPPSFFFIRAGTTLYQLTTASGHISLSSAVILLIFAVLSLLPVIFKRVLRKKLD